MSVFEKMFNETNVSVGEEQKTKNTKYVKLTYTRNGTVVLSATNNKSESISKKELTKFMNV